MIQQKLELHFSIFFFKEVLAKLDLTQTFGLTKKGKKGKKERNALCQ